MAASENQIYSSEASRATAQIVPLPKRERTLERKANEVAGRAGEILRTTKDSARAAYEYTRKEAVETYSRARDKAQDMARRTQNRARQAKQEHPVQLLAIAFGAAVIAGISLRIWRARAS